ncbi:MAG: sulfide/dihydroorotate dehydrogenase-like FAD/NAD-binding protein [Candidatus Aminicenantes bacterium]|nr:sulfide/dihydroorotate dehydrogenase-like FAD/NAD-binding protein [Candidatus Aminicenantes bacterium]
MFDVLERKMIVPNLHQLTVLAPDVAKVIEPGQFVIVRADGNGERLPLSVADWDRASGALTVIFMEVGASTGRLAALMPGDRIPTVVGPLGRPTALDRFGTVACIGGCYGIGSLFPAIRALHEKGNRVIAFMEARSGYLHYWQERLAPYCQRLFLITRDGSAGIKGHAGRIADVLREEAIVPQRIFVNGCTFLIYKASIELARFDVPVIVSLNPIMIDGTGMCGVCRVTVDGKTRFACVDGPDFDGRQVDWAELLKRRKQYVDEEAFLVHDSGCGRRHP